MVFNFSPLYIYIYIYIGSSIVEALGSKSFAWVSIGQKWRVRGRGMLFFKGRRED
jgi:hypothetical protein